jgi:lipopolysaccharide cholinephosphotransferase
MNKILLFGLTKDLEVYLKNIRNYGVHVIGVVGRSHEVKKTNYCGLPIFSIESIGQLDYQEIHVLPSAFKLIKNELMDQGVDEKRIFSPPKSLLHNHLFSDIEITNFVEKFLADITNYGIYRNINIFLDAGTLLGFARGGKLIPWDNDIDFSICEKDINALVSILDDLGNESYSIFYEISEGVISGYVSYNLNQIPFDFYVRRFNDGIAINLSEDFLSADSIHFLESDLYQVNNCLKVLFPKYHQKYLESVYGVNWLVPNVNFSFADYVQNN